MLKMLKNLNIVLYISCYHRLILHCCIIQYIWSLMQRSTTFLVRWTCGGSDGGVRGWDGFAHTRATFTSAALYACAHVLAHQFRGLTLGCGLKVEDPCSNPFGKHS
uniref:Uncharacterized protein n=1 Tax=Micrurus paraensis TaxID=1970185 RepID=A0A2D4KT40_9SAUR